MRETSDTRCIALRRTPRACTTRSVSAAAVLAPCTNSNHISTNTTTLNTRTPGKPKSRKRVRFSDPGAGQDSPAQHQQDPPSTSSTSTGLTPLVKRSSMTSPSAKRRRHSTPIRTTLSSPSSYAFSSPSTSHLAAQSSSSSESIRFPSLRQILSDRVKRRIRRAGLSEEMNVIDAEKHELKKLRNSLADKDAEIERLREESMLSLSSATAFKDSTMGDVTMVQHDLTAESEDMSSSRLLKLGHEVETLRQQLAMRSSPPSAAERSSPVVEEPSRFFDWTMSARDPYSDDYTDMDMQLDIEDNRMDDSGFGDSTMIDLVCSTPSRRQRRAAQDDEKGDTMDPARSFPSPPCTSPTIPATPCSVRQTVTRVMLPPPSSHMSVSVQAALPSPETEALKQEIESLRLELGKITETLESHSGLQTRLSAKLASGLSSLKSSNAEAEGLVAEPISDTDRSNEDIEFQLDDLLQTLSDRTEALQHLNASLSSLGFAGTDSSEIITSLTSSLRAARIELEYLDPGELTLPLSSHGAEVLNLILTKLRDMARQQQDNEAEIDEYHQLEFSLRKQLSTRVDLTQTLRTELKGKEQSLEERDERIRDLEVGVDRLKGAAEGYRRDIVELENLVQDLDAKLVSDAGDAEKSLQEKAQELETVREAGEERVAKTQEELRATKEELEMVNAALVELGDKLVSAISDMELLEKQLSEMDEIKRREVEAVHKMKKKEIKAINERAAAALKLRDARVMELKMELDLNSSDLRSAYDKTHKLKVANLTLARELKEERIRAQQTLEEMKVQMRKLVEANKELVNTPKRRSSRGASANKSSRKRSSASAPPEEFTKRPRRYDSGIGLMDEDEIDELS